MSTNKKNDTGVREKVQGRKPRLNVLVNNYLTKHQSRIHQADIDEVIAKLQKINGLKPAPVVVPAPAAVVPVTGEVVAAVAPVTGEITPVEETGSATIAPETGSATIAPETGSATIAPEQSATIAA